MSGSFKNILIVAGLIALSVLMSSCSNDEQQTTSKYGDIYGDGYLDTSDIICKVGDLEISQRDLEMRYEELPANLQKRFSGEDWQRRFLKFMIGESILVTNCLDQKVDADPIVKRNLISQRRYFLAEGYKSVKLYGDIEIEEQILRDFYKEYKEKYMNLGAMRARHIQCDDKASADVAWTHLQGTGKKNQFLYVCAKHSTNKDTAYNGGEIGWFNKGGHVPLIENGQQFSEAVWGLDYGLHEPVKVGNKWHIVDVMGIQQPQQRTFEESRDQIIKEMMPAYKNQALSNFMETALSETSIEYFGAYQPGGGRTAEELFRSGMSAKETETKIYYYEVILEDYADDPYAAKALFMLANVQIDNWLDFASAERYLNKLINEYPDSEMVDQAVYLLENMRKPGFSSPKRIQDLQN